MDLKKDDNEVRQLFNQNLPLLEDLLYLYQQSDVAGKQTLLKGIFPGCLIKEKEGYGTPYVNSLFSLEALPVKGLLRIKKMGKPGFDTSFPISTPQESQLEPLFDIVELILIEKKCA